MQLGVALVLHQRHAVAVLERLCDAHAHAQRISDRDAYSVAHYRRHALGVALSISIGLVVADSHL